MQCSGLLSVDLANPSFEGDPRAHITPPSWTICNNTPDTQPGSWGVTQSASDGNTYIGLIAGGPTWLEGVSQALSTPLLSGSSYGMLIDLSATDASGGGISSTSYCTLEIWGADSICDQDELLWSSPTIDHVGWQTYQAIFTPASDHHYIYFIVNGIQNAYLLLDNLRSSNTSMPVFDVAAADSMPSGCSVTSHGTANHITVDSITVEGNFTDSPITISINDPVWEATLSYHQAGYEGISITAYGHDSLNAPLLCGQIGLTVLINGPIADFSYMGTCSNTDFLFSDLSAPFDTATVIGWSWDFDSLGSSSAQDPSFLFNGSGIFDVQLTVFSSDGCADDTTISVDVYAAPEADFSFTEICLGHSTNFHDLSEQGDGLLSNWHWDLGDGNTSALEDPVHTYTDTGEFHVQLVVTDLNGCRDSITQGVEVFLCASVNEQTMDDRILTYPNPAVDVLYVESDLDKIGAIRLFDPRGKLIEERSNLNSRTVSIPVEEFSSGIYSLELWVNDLGVIHRQFIIP